MVDITKNLNHRSKIIFNSINNIVWFIFNESFSKEFGKEKVCKSHK